MAYKYVTVKNHPAAFEDKVDCILLNLSYAYPGYMQRFTKVSMERLLFAETENEEQNLGIIELLVELGYLVNERNEYHISSGGWSRIDLLQRERECSNYGFVAIKFVKETDEIREVIRKGIEDANYQCTIIDELEHNNQIVPEIFHQIDNCRFLVMDVIFSNLGAYYEAGYALGKGKEVIICCREDEFNNDDKEVRPHFDIAQKSTIVWKDYDDLEERLKKELM